MKTPFSLFLVTAGAALLLAAAPCRATQLYSQDFESLVSGSLSGQAGFTSVYETGTTSVTTSGGQSYSNGSVTVPGGNNEATIDAAPPSGSNNSNNNWALTNTFATQTGGSTVYFSLAMSWSSLSTASTVFFALTNSETNSPALGKSGGFILNGLGTGNSTVLGGGRIRNSGSGDQGQSTASTSASSNYPGFGNNTTSTQFIVGSLSHVGVGSDGSDYDTLQLWIDPSSTTLSTPNVTISYDMGTSSLSTFYLFTGSADSRFEVINVDNIEIGTTAADVLEDVTAVPEPTSWALLLGGVALLDGARRKLWLKL